MIRLRVAPDHWQELRDATSDVAGRERMAFLLCGRYQAKGQVTLLSHGVRTLEDDAYQISRRDQLGIDPIAVNRILIEAERSNLSVVMAHTHPGARVARFSSADLHGESRLFPLVCGRMPDRPHGAVVLGEEAAAFRNWQFGSDDPEDGVLEVLGQPRTTFPAATVPEKADDRRESLFLGRGALEELSRLEIVVVGLGGTGSLFTQMLAHLGVRKLTLIDPDTVESTNLGRLVGATPSDVGRLKTTIARRAIQKTNPDATVDEIPASVLSQRALPILLSADIIVCCTDTHSSRVLLNRIAWQFLIPVVDVGVLIRLSEAPTRPTFAGGAVRMVGSGYMCLICADQIDSQRVMYELKTVSENEMDRQFGYVAGFAASEPAVITLNSTITGIAATVLMNFVRPIMPPLTGQLIVDLIEPTFRRIAAGHRRGCDVCDPSGVVGRGDTALLPATIP